MSPGARMLWIGDGPSRAALQREHPQHLFSGVLRGHELARHFASADLFLFPSLTETFGNVTLEAMASGLTVCAFDYAAAHEHIVSGVSGELAPFAKASAFVRTAEKAACAWLKGKRLGDAARRAVEHLSPQRVAEDFAQLLVHAGLPIKSPRQDGAKPRCCSPFDVCLNSSAPPTCASRAGFGGCPIGAWRWPFSPRFRASVTASSGTR